MHIVTQLVKKSDKDGYRQLFDDLDKDADGTLSKTDVLGGLSEPGDAGEELRKDVMATFSCLEQAGYESVHYSGS